MDEFVFSSGARGPKFFLAFSSRRVGVQDIIEGDRPSQSRRNVDR